MPETEKQRRAAFAELNRRGKGKKGRSFKGMSSAELKEYAHSKKHKKGKGKRGRSSRFSARDQADALRSMKA